MASTTPPIPPARRPAPSAATWPRTPAAPTAWPTASPQNHVLGLEVVLRRRQHRLAGRQDAPTAPAMTCAGVVIGSEGTLAIVTKIIVRLSPLPPATVTLLAIFDAVDQASQAVSTIIGQGILPAALEMMDRATMEAVEAARPRRLPAGRRRRPPHRGRRTGGIAPPAGGADRDHLPRARAPARCASASRPRTASASGRGARAPWAPWAAWRPATTSSMAPSPAPSSRASCGACTRSARSTASSSPTSSTPATATCTPTSSSTKPSPAQLEKVLAAGAEILRLCVDAGGTITGEHGIGMEKREFMRWVYSDDDIEAQARIKIAFGAGDGFNPEKIFPTAPESGDVASHQRAVIQSLGPDAYV